MTGEREADTGLRSCGRCGGESPARANFCMECGAPLEVAPAADDTTDDTAGERRVVSVLFADLSGFTAYSERTDPEVVRRLAHEAAEGLGEIVDRYGGTVDKVIGDCVMAVFGAPVGHEDDPERAVRAALDMQTYITQHTDRFAGMPLRIGINTGEVMFAPVGADGRFTVIGDTVNTAARLQSAAARGEVVVGAPTHDLVARIADTEAVAPIIAKGKEEPVPAWRVVGIKGAAEAPIRVRRIASVGRTKDAGRLLEAWERVRTDRVPARVCLVGGPGVGKTRLIADLIESLGGVRSLRGACLPYGEGITYWPIAEIVREIAGVPHDATVAEVSARLDAFLEALPTADLDELRTIASALSHLLGAPTTPRGTYIASRITKGELHWGIRRTLQLVAADMPTLVVVENLQWAEPTLIELLDYLVAESGLPLLVLVSARDEIRERVPEFLEWSANRRTFNLEALSSADAAALLAALLGLAELPEGPLWNLAARANGNPLFLEEMAAALNDAGIVDGVGNVVGEIPDAIAAPKSLRALIGARLDLLDQREHRLAQTASVIGEVFWDGAVVSLGEAPDEVNAGMRSLIDRDVIVHRGVSTVQGEQERAFHHILVRDVAYDRLPKERRADLHVRCGEWIGALPGGDDDRIEIVAYHMEQAVRYASDMGQADPARAFAAASILVKAAEKAERREGTREAEGFLARAVALIGDDFPETAVELRLRRTRTLAVLGELDAAVAELAAVGGAAQAVERPDLRCRALLDLAGIASARRQADDAHAAIEEALTLADALGDELLRARAGYVLANVRSNLDADTEGATSELRRAMTLLRRRDQPELLAEGHLRLGALSFNVGDLGQAEREYEACIDLARELGSLRYQAMATSLLGGVKLYRGPLEDAEQRSREALTWLRRIGERYVELQTLRSLGIAALRKGEFEESERWFVQALDVGGSGGSWLVPELHRLLAEALIGQGRLDEARDEVGSARDTARPEDAYAQAAVALAEGALAAAEEDSTLARHAFGRAADILATQDLLTDLGDARFAFGRALERLGEPAGAAEQYALARDTFRAVGATAMAEALDERLGHVIPSDSLPP